ncbi:hypothetical protein QJS04_geneDACA018181 [Acorus gramineus]|uniref:CID domain-containing protein n=1 Tax=Acorus gramineus TaxID=55184 RepID=A0AAV9BTJ4_ACOGR|nr:hypothetical protein QJS04_geneDACA018181 [Acorus gramineus]
MMREREEDEEEDVVAGGGGAEEEEIVRMYEELLGELTLNSKPIITDLTIIAGEQREFAAGIARAICDRVLEVPAEQKLPSLYLLDSIVKNIGRDYLRHFATRLPEVFCEAYKQVHPSLYPAMRHLFGTWSTVFPSPVRRQIEAELQFSSSMSHQSANLTDLKSSESLSPHPSHGIHVNPKYLEARRQFEHSDADEHGRSVSSGGQIYGRKPTIGHGEYDSDRSEIPRMHSPKIAPGRGFSTSGNEKLVPHSKNKQLRPSSPNFKMGRSRSPSVEGLARDISPGSAMDRASPSHAEYGANRISGRNLEKNDWWKRNLSNDGAHGVHNISNGHDNQRPRALIDAYGNYRGKIALNEKLPEINVRGINGLNSETASRNWQNSEEEEYVWEDMSPTLADCNKNNDFMSFNSTVGSTSADLRRTSVLPMETDFRRSDWDRQTQLPSVDQPSIGVDERGYDLGSSNGPLSKKPRYTQNSFPQSKQQYVRETSRGSAFQMPFSARGLDSSVGSDSSKMEFPSTSVQEPHPPSLAPVLWPPVHKSHPPPLHPGLVQQKYFKNQSGFTDTRNSVVNQGLNLPSILPPTQVDDAARRNPMFLKMPQKQPGGFIDSHQLCEQQPSLIRPPFFPMSHDNIVPSHQTFTNINTQQGMNPVLLNPLSKGGPSLQIHSGSLPPLPPGPPPASSQMGPTQGSTGSTGNNLSGLISSLVAQGLISLTAPAPSQDSVGLEFNTELIKVRHEPAINALYADLPRQCTTCGLRFISQEEHSSHMDWHVTKNRTSKNRKQKPSRKWFVSAKEWLSGAEAMGTDAVPGFLPSETIVEKRGEKELAVPADEDQNVCALCGESFEDFYSDETEEWMYKGAVYLNAPDGSIEGMQRPQLGPIVHAKCRSETTEDLGQTEGGS